VARFLVDEDMPVQTAEELRKHGHDAQDVRDLHLRGMSDEAIFEYASKEQRTVITRDLDYGQMAMSFPNHSGVVLVRVEGLRSPRIIEEVVRRLPEVEEGDFAGNIIVLEAGRVRIRRAR